MGVPPFLIHFSRIFHEINHPASLGYPHFPRKAPGRSGAALLPLCHAHWIHGGMVINHHQSILPSGKHTKNYGKSPFFMGKSTISMVIFNSYVKLPEGRLFYIPIFHDEIAILGSNSYIPSIHSMEQ